MKALSVRAPWWWFILYGGKDIENHSLTFPRVRREPVWIHVGKWWRPQEVWADCEEACAMQARAIELTGREWPRLKDWRKLELSCGCIVGSVTIADYVDGSDSPWFVGETGLVLCDPIALPRAIPCKGALGFFDVPAGLISDAV